MIGFVSKGFSLVLALLLFTVSAFLCCYSVNKSREIGGWAVLGILLGWLFLLPASWFLLSGVFGWDF